MSGKLYRTIQTVAVVAWLVSGVDVLPVGPDLPPDAGLFVVALGCVCSYAWIARVHARPIDEVYRAGIEVGRQRTLAEQEASNVTRLPPARSRSLRVVESPRAQGQP